MSGKGFLSAVAGLGALALFAAPQGSVTRYLIVSGDSMSGSWDSRDEHSFRQFRSQYGDHFAWFREGSRDYIVTSSQVLAEIDAAMAPQREVNRQQGEVNRHQSDVNRLQNEVNTHQRDVNRDQSDVNRQQALVNHGGGSQSDVNRLQSDVNAKQRDVNVEQERVNREQAVVNKEQGVVNKAQSEANVEIRQALQGIFDSAIARGFAREVR